MLPTSRARPDHCALGVLTEPPQTLAPPTGSPQQPLSFATRSTDHQSAAVSAPTTRTSSRVRSTCMC
eukprot:7086881-Prymnesium_polylepis.2